MSSIWRIGLDILRVSAPALIAVTYLRYHIKDVPTVSNWRALTYVIDLALVAVPLHVFVERLPLPYFSDEVDSLRCQFYDRLRGIRLPKIPFIVRLRLRQAYCCILIPCYCVLVYSSIYYTFYNLTLSAKLLACVIPVSLHVNEYALLAFQRISIAVRVVLMLTGFTTLVVGIVRGLCTPDHAYVLTVLNGLVITAIGDRFELVRTFNNRFWFQNGNAFHVVIDDLEILENRFFPIAEMQEFAGDEPPMDRILAEEIIGIEVARERANNFQQIQNVLEENPAQDENNMDVIVADDVLPDNLNLEQIENVAEENLAQNENDFVMVAAVDNEPAEDIDDHEMQNVLDILNN